MKPSILPTHKSTNHLIISSPHHLIISLFLIFSFSIFSTQAAYLKDIPTKLIQPNGEVLHCYASGDEFYNYLHDKDGYTIIQNNEGYYMYAMYDGNIIVASQFVAGTVNPSTIGLQPNVTISTKEYHARRSIWFDYDDIPRHKTSDRNHGTLNNLVVFIRFLGEAEISTIFSSVDNMFNNQTQGYNSMINYFKTTSYGHLTIPSYFFPEPNGNLILSYEDIYPRNYYQPYHSVTNPDGYQGGDNGWERTTREHTLLRNAVEYIANHVPTDLNIDYDDDGYVDNVCFVIKGNVGNWANLLWPHRWALWSEYASIHGKQVWDYNFMLEDESHYFSNAVLSHEMQHTLSFPDLYHYYHSGPTPVGNWDIMESNPHPPQQSGGYMKWKHGNWLFEPTIIQPGKYTLNSIGSGLGFVSYKIPSNDPSQFFVLEYRNANDPFDKCYPNGTGMLIYRINTTWNGNAGYNPPEGVYDEVYIFRSGGNDPTQYGTIEQAHFGPNGRTVFDANSNPKPFLTHGEMVTGLSITDITITGNKVSFTYNGGTTQFVSVAYQPNGGKSIMVPQMFEAGVEQNLYTNSFTFPGETFLGWALTPDGEVEYTDNQSIAIYEDIVLYAVWSLPPPVYYTIMASVLQPVKTWPLTIIPEGEVQVLEHSSQTFVIQADTTYPLAPKIVAIEVDGMLYYPQNEEERYRMEYTFDNITKNHYIIAISDATGVNENQEINDLFSIQPNPANELCEISLTDVGLTMQNITVQIYNIQGLLLASLPLSNKKTQIDISNLTKGLYFVTIGHETKKLIVK